MAIAYTRTMLVRADFDYAAYYCEENVWRLLVRAELGSAERWALAVFGTAGAVAVANQRAGRPGDGLIVWDYHVAALLRTATGPVVVDFDARGDFAKPLDEYLAASFPAGRRRAWAAAGLAPRFRAVAGAEYARRFDSDRSHMRSPDGTWLKPPPVWDSPRAAGTGGPVVKPLSLSLLIDPAADPADAGGAALDMAGLRRFAASGG
jgi:hypothetical protein